VTGDSGLPDSLLLSTRNPHKVREFARLLGAAGVAVEPLPATVSLPPEDGETFAENALPKARAAAAATGRIAIADDSGIEAEALGGRPGVRSARYAGKRATDEQNLRKLLDEAPVGSGLRYVCALAWVDPASGEEHVVFGECRGRVSDRVAGEGGFGYDPAFVPTGAERAAGAITPGPEGRERTMAELSDAEKDAISHRGRAVRALLGWLASRAG
jgi:XTP/dITP diphosphohydrolase